LEHEAVDPLGVEHSWRLDVAFVEKEVEAIRNADPSRPIMMNGFLPTSLPVRFFQWWRTRDQADSLAVAQRIADIVGIDYYPRHALLTVGTKTVYLDGSKSPWEQRRRKHLFAWTRAHGQKLMIAEGQAEPWETVTVPPNPDQQGMYSCLPEQVITNFNRSEERRVGKECRLRWVNDNSSRRRHTRFSRDWSSDVCSSDLK